MDERVWFEQLYSQYADFLFRIGRRLLTGRDDSVLYDAWAADADIDDSIGFRNAMERPCHEGIVIGSVAEHHEL